MQVLSAFFLGQGRICRAAWHYRMLAIGVICTAFAMLADSIMGEAGKALFAAAFVWSAGALSIQRLHDTGRSGQSLLFLIIPVLGPLVVLFFICRRGHAGANLHGVDPVAPSDYAQVNISRCPQ